MYVNHVIYVNHCDYNIYYISETDLVKNVSYTKLCSNNYVVLLS